MFQNLFDSESALHQRPRYRLRWDWFLRNLLMACIPAIAAYAFVTYFEWRFKDEIDLAVAQRRAALAQSRGEPVELPSQRNLVQVENQKKSDEEGANQPVNGLNLEEILEERIEEIRAVMHDDLQKLERKVESLESLQQSSSISVVTVPESSIFASRAVTRLRRLLQNGPDRETRESVEPPH